MYRFTRLQFNSFYILATLGLSLAACGVKDSGSSQPAAVNEMINAFSNGCNMGQWTQAALNRSASIVAMYESLRSSASCKDDTALLDSALHSAQAMQAQLRAMTEDVAVSQARQMEDASNDLLITIKNFDRSGAPVDKSLRDSLIDQYSSARYSQALATANVNYAQNPSYKTRYTYGMAQVNGYMSSLLVVSDKLSLCYSKNPSVAVELGANIAELVGSFASPAVGLGISALSKLLQFGVVASRTMPPAESIYQTNKNKMPTALQCGLEALSRDYCKAKDAALLASLSRKNEKQETSPFYVGMEILDRYFPSLNAWLDRVVNGSDITNDPDQAARINVQYNRYAMAGTMKRLADANIAYTTKKIADSASVDDKVAQIKRGLKTVVNAYFPYNNGGGDPVTPSDGVFAGFDGARSLTLKLIAPKGLKHPNGNFNSVYDMVDDADLDATDWANITQNANSLYRARYEDIVNEFNSKVNVNIPGLVRDATTLSKDEEVSPLQALQRIFYFFEHYAFDDCNQQRDQIIITQLKDRIRRVYDQLNDPNSVDDSPQEVECPDNGKKDSDKNPPDAPKKKCYDISPAKKTIAMAFDAFKLDKNNVFLPGSMSKLVSTDLSTRFLRGEGPKDIDELYRLAGADLDLLFRRMKLTPALVQADTDSARQISSDNLKEFRNRFLPSIRMAMQDLKKSADDAKEPAAGDVNSPIRNVLSRLCILTLITGADWPEDLDATICADAKIISREAKLELEFKDLQQMLAGKSFSDRVCAYEEFLRYDRLANAEFRNPRKKNDGENSCRISKNDIFGSSGSVNDTISHSQNIQFWQGFLLKR